jgi:hypothetical protein
VKLALRAFTARLSTATPKLIDRSFDHGSIGEERLDQPLDLTGQVQKCLPKLTESLTIFLTLYAHI